MDEKAIAMTPVTSSNIAKLGYDVADMILVIEFKSGGTYHYKGVSIDQFRAFITAESVGKHYHSDIRGKFDAEKIEEDQDGDSKE